MEVISTVLLFGLAAVPLVVTGGWFAARGHRGLGSLVGGGGASWWRSQMPWPQGVQESDDVHWHFADPVAPTAASEQNDPTDLATEGAPVDVDRVESHVRMR